MLAVKTALLACCLVSCGGQAAAPHPTAAPPAVVAPPPATPARIDAVRPPATGNAKPAPLLVTMTAELARSMGELHGHADPPYFASYEVSDGRFATASASLGVLDHSSESRNRWLDVDVRVGDYQRDNTHAMADGGSRLGRDHTVSESLPIEDDDFSIRTTLWLATDRAYKHASEQLQKVEANEKVKTESEDKSGDFSHEKPSEYLEAADAVAIDRAAWEPRLRALSAEFRKYPEILNGTVSISSTSVTQYYVSSEGTRYQLPNTHVRVMISAQAIADDGMQLHRTESFDVASLAALPSDDQITAKITSIAQDLVALRKAPIAEPYLGPAILEGKAAGVFFHEVFGHRIEGHRQKNDAEGQTFAKKIGQPIMPDFIDVYDDPTIASLNGRDLNGFYRYDDEGAAAQRASLVERGVLKTFLLGRSPTRGFTASNGHGRRSQGYSAVSRQGNLVVAPTRTVPHAKLKELLLAQVKEQGKPYGLLFRELDGGFTMTQRFEPQSFKLLPIMVFRVYPDGREELVRGADLEGTPLRALADIVAAGDDVDTFNGYCGAESGFVPVSASSPSLLVAHVEVAKKAKSHDKPPLLPAPEAKPGTDDPTVRAMKDELARSLDKLELPGSSKPYYVAYDLYDTYRVHASASFGALVSSYEEPRRTLDLDLRVGDRTFDNSNVMTYDRGRSVTLPVEADYDAVRRDLWLATDREYKRAAETLERKRAVAKAETKSSDAADSFSNEPPSHITADHAVVKPDRGKLEALAKKLSAVFRKNPDAFEGTVTITAMSGHQLFMSTEGSQSLQADSFVRIEAECRTQASDGMPLHDSRTFFAHSLDELPTEAELVAEVERLSQELSALRKAPVIDDYSGPILFAGVTAPEVVRVLLAEELSGTPPPKADRPGAHPAGDSELVGKVGQRILPPGTTIVDDPTVVRAGKVALAGTTHFDEEGMPAQKVVVVENGTFKRFLMSRTPRKGFEHSNGHAASSPMSALRAHPMNLFVSSSKAISDAELRKRAIAAAKDAGLKYVLVVDRLDLTRGGDDFDASMFAGSGTPLPKPGVIKRVYLDGHEELVRGATFGAVPLRSFKDIVAIGATATAYEYLGSGMPSRFGMFEGSTGYFVSIVAPGLLFRDLDIKKPQGPQRVPPIATRPQ